MIYPAADIIKDVRQALDNNVTAEALHDTGDIETLTLEQCIRSHIADAARQVLAQAPVGMIDTGKPLPQNTERHQLDPYGGWALHLPDDCFRLLRLRMEGWHKAVTHTIADTDPLYTLQTSPHGGVRGNAWRPVVAIVRRATGLWAECYSCQSDEEPHIDSSLYLSVPAIDNRDGINIPTRLYFALIYATAALTAATYADNEAYQRLMALASNQYTTPQ